MVAVSSPPRAVPRWTALRETSTTPLTPSSTKQWKSRRNSSDKPVAADSNSTADSPSHACRTAAGDAGMLGGLPHPAALPPRRRGTPPRPRVGITLKCNHVEQYSSIVELHMLYEVIRPRAHSQLGQYLCMCAVLRALFGKQVVQRCELSSWSGERREEATGILGAVRGKLSRRR